MAIWPLMARVMTLLSNHDSANGPFFNYKGGEGGGVQDSAIMYFGSEKHNGQAENVWLLSRYL